MPLLPAVRVVGTPDDRHDQPTEVRVTLPSEAHRLRDRRVERIWANRDLDHGRLLFSAAP